MFYKLKPIAINAMQMDAGGVLEIADEKISFSANEWLVKWPTGELEILSDAKFQALTGNPTPKVQKERKPRVRKNGMAGTVLGTEQPRAEE